MNYLIRTTLSDLSSLYLNISSEVKLIVSQDIQFWSALIAYGSEVKVSACNSGDPD